ncbi:phospholipase D family protein [Simplicispira suum]|uniref:Phospholipase n=1 Tax=Simplicispira suum TaxID=2109915 RepID=A0A2S0N1H3_9BURK|nr:phospholipase D family protein [Simplicispira suum]AVO41992.1 phospholipase [Simplicispira suum]MBW7834129.1 phospholipase D family protein [Simplicispira suum]
MKLRPLFATAGLACVLSACSGLPENVERPVSHALATPASTTLSSMVTQRRDQARARSNSGFLLLSGPDDAYGSRLALTEAAEKTLDLQYYAIHADASTARLLRSVVQAARRGVRVRVLLDDFHSTGRDAQVMRLAFEPNIEMRMFNPVAGPRASKIGRMFSAVMDFSRAQQRMHNKLFIADNAMGVTGGRNLGDAYFGNAEAGNFVDLDVLAAGPIVADLSRSFDKYWNNKRAYPVESLISKEELLKMREKIRAEDAAQADEPAQDATQEQAQAVKQAKTAKARVAAIAPASAAEPGNGTVTKQDVKEVQKQHAAQFEPMDLAHARFVWAPAVMLADEPAKIAAESSPGPAPRENAVPAKTATLASGNAQGEPDAESAQKAPPFSEPPGETVVDGLLQLMGQAKHELLIVSPYFVPGKNIMQAFEEARERGVRVRVLTNSLASNDAPIAHAGYMGHRKAMLDLGLELYEMRSEQAGLRNAFGLSGSGGSATGSSRAMLHSKFLVMDGQLLAIGSMNLDLRSELQNTEIALLIRSRKLAAIAGKQIEAGMRDLAWHVEQDEQGLIWHAPKGSDLEDTRSEPDTSFLLRLLMNVLGPLAPDHLL